MTLGPTQHANILTGDCCNDMGRILVHVLSNLKANHLAAAPLCHVGREESFRELIYD